ncbi:nucleotidyltransferase domain-containing protein [Candidatus Pacearchaeota archaeon]|nr:nucleotidyltransferase domain-containing protein [Candidatus Pacearchaeota archaeon]
MKEEKWEMALNKFIVPWKNNKEVSGIIICGSYITGNPTKHSDIDIYVVLKKGCRWRERGNEIVDGILMEYFANPPEQIEKYLEGDFKKRRQIDAHMFHTGKIILDREGELERLKKLSKKYLNKKFEKITPYMYELGKYDLFDMSDNLEEVYFRKTPDFNFVYFNFLEDAFSIYSEFLRYHQIGENKIYRFLTDKKDRSKYLISDFPDKVFLKNFVLAIKEKNQKKMLRRFVELSKYIQDKMGGFNIDGWKFKSNVE